MNQYLKYFIYFLLGVIIYYFLFNSTNANAQKLIEGFELTQEELANILAPVNLFNGDINFTGTGSQIPISYLGETIKFSYYYVTADTERTGRMINTYGSVENNEAIPKVSNTLTKVLPADSTDDWKAEHITPDDLTDNTKSFYSNSNYLVIFSFVINPAESTPNNILDPCVNINIKIIFNTNSSSNPDWDPLNAKVTDHPDILPSEQNKSGIFNITMPLSELSYNIDTWIPSATSAGKLSKVKEFQNTPSSTDSTPSPLWFSIDLQNILFDQDVFTEIWTPSVTTRELSDEELEDQNKAWDLIDQNSTEFTFNQMRTNNNIEPTNPDTDILIPTKQYKVTVADNNFTVLDNLKLPGLIKKAEEVNSRYFLPTYYDFLRLSEADGGTFTYTEVSPADLDKFNYATKLINNGLVVIEGITMSLMEYCHQQRLVSATAESILTGETYNEVQAVQILTSGIGSNSPTDFKPGKGLRGCKNFHNCGKEPPYNKPHEHWLRKTDTLLVAAQGSLYETCFNSTESQLSQHLGDSCRTEVCCDNNTCNVDECPPGTLPLKFRPCQIDLRTGPGGCEDPKHCCSTAATPEQNKMYDEILLFRNTHKGTPTTSNQIIGEDILYFIYHHLIDYGREDAIQNNLNIFVGENIGYDKYRLTNEFFNLKAEAISNDAEKHFLPPSLWFSMY